MLSPFAIAELAHAAGWRGKDLTVAIAVALAESGGRETARGDTGLVDATWGPSIGLWQIRSLNAEKGNGTLRDELANADPATNARHAYQIWSSQGWGPWSAHNNRRYLLFMPAATAAVAARVAAGPIGTKALGAVDDAATNLGGDVLETAQTGLALVVKAGKWMSDPGNWLRVSYVVVGGAMLVVALAMIAGPVAEAGLGKAANVAIGSKVKLLTGGGKK